MIMLMLMFTLVWMPGIVAAGFYRKLRKQNFAAWDWMYHSAKFIFAITFLNLLALTARGWGDFAFERISVIFAVKYLGLSLVFAGLLPWLNDFISKKFPG